MSKRKLKNTLSAAAALLMLTAATSSNAETGWWAWGKIEFVQQTSTSFIIGLTTDAADGCLNNRIYLYEHLIGESAVQRAVAFALAAQASDREMGMVIDLDKKVAGERCDALGNMVMR